MANHVQVLEYKKLGKFEIIGEEPMIHADGKLKKLLHLREINGKYNCYAFEDEVIVTVEALDVPSQIKYTITLENSEGIMLGVISCVGQDQTLREVTRLILGVGSALDEWGEIMLKIFKE